MNPRRNVSREYETSFGRSLLLFRGLPRVRTAEVSALPEIAGAVGDRIEVLFDSGIRSGQDVLKALARGARGCLIGRAFLYGLAAGGEAGVRRALDVIRAELEVTMALTGQRDVRAITREAVVG